MNWFKWAQTIPAVAAPNYETHTVANGETLSSIAKKILGNANRWEEISKINPGINVDKLSIGQVINIPSSQSASAVPAATTVPTAPVTPVPTDNTKEQDQTGQEKANSPSSTTDLKSRLMQSEGFRESSYFDPPNQRVVKSVGYGFNLSRPDATGLFKSLGLNVRQVYNGSQKLTQKQAEFLLDAAIKVAISDANSTIPNLSSHPIPVQEAIMDMAYNMGVATLGKFKKMIAAINAKNYKKAADEMLDSTWSKQVGRRAIALAEMVRNSK